jgi:hypothetical protein
MAASLDDILTAIKNGVQAINNWSQTNLQINGFLTASNITTATQVKNGQGRLCYVSVIVAGSTVGKAYDTVGTTSTANVIFTIPNTVGVTFVNLPVSNGLVIVPGTGQTVAVSYS